GRSSPRMRRGRDPNVGASPQPHRAEVFDGGGASQDSPGFVHAVAAGYSIDRQPRGIARHPADGGGVDAPRGGQMKQGNVLCGTLPSLQKDRLQHRDGGSEEGEYARTRGGFEAAAVADFDLHAPAVPTEGDAPLPRLAGDDASGTHLPDREMSRVCPAAGVANVIHGASRGAARLAAEEAKGPTQLGGRAHVLLYHGGIAVGEEGERSGVAGGWGLHGGAALRQEREQEERSRPSRHGVHRARYRVLISTNRSDAGGSASA